MSRRVETWQNTGVGLLERRGRSPKYFDPEFSIGQTEPTRLNTGPTVSEVQMDVISGNVTSVNPSVPIERKIITGQFRPNNTGLLRDFIIRGGPAPSPGSSWNLIDTRSLNIDTPFRFEHGHINPSHRSVDIYGFAYGGIDAYRVLVEGVVDGASIHGGGSWPNTINRIVKFHACMFTDSPFYEYDPRQTDGSHNDFNQAHGSLSLYEVWGCSFGADGERAAACILIQQGHGLFGEINIIENWFYGHKTKGAVFNMSEDRGVPYTNLKFWRNRVDPESNHSNPAPVLVKTGSRFPANFGMLGTNGSPPNTWTPGPNCNVYMGTGLPVPIKSG